MKKVVILILAISIGTMLHAQINFEHSALNELKLKAKQEHKLIMIDAYTSWCGPCKWMAANTFTNKKVGDFFNNNFVNAKIDMEKGEGLEIAKQYEVNAYPTILFINTDGKLMHRSVGALDSTGFLVVGNDALNPEKQFGTFYNKYVSGAKDEAFLATYIYKADAAGFDTEKIVDDYFKTQKVENYTSQVNWNIIRDFVFQKNNVQFKYLVKNKKAFDSKYTKDSVNTKIEDVYASELSQLVYAKKFDAVTYKSTKTEFSALKTPNAEKVIIQSDLTLHQKNKNGALYGKTAILYFDKYATTDANEINGVAYTVYELSNDKIAIAKAEEWAKTAVQLSKADPMIMDTYACLLSKNNKKQQALEVEKDAISIMKTNPAQYNESMIADFQKNIDTWSK